VRNSAQYPSGAPLRMPQGSPPDAGIRIAATSLSSFAKHSSAGDSMKIQDIMTRDPETVTPEATVREAAQIMLREEVGIVPVVAGSGDNRLVGILTDRDIAIRCVAEGRDGSCKVRDAMSSGELSTCRQSDDVDSLMQVMRTEKVRRIPIVDDRGSLLGIVSQADIALKVHDPQRSGRTVEGISERGGRHAR
jgi:CBS domain-containing protein